MNAKERKALRDTARQTRDFLAQLRQATAAAVTKAQADVEARYADAPGVDLRPLKRAEATKVRAAALDIPKRRELAVLASQLKAAAADRPDVSDRRTLLPRRPPPREIALPTDGWLTERQMTETIIASNTRTTAALERLTFVLEMPHYRPAELAAEAAAAAQRNDRDTFALAYRALHADNRTGAEVEAARVTVGALLSRLPLSEDVQEHLDDADAIAKDANEIEQSLVAFDQGVEDSATTWSESARLSAELGTEAYLQHRADQKAARGDVPAARPKLKIPVSDSAPKDTPPPADLPITIVQPTDSVA